MVKKEAGRQDREADVVIVGYGGAGATAAICAHDRGARVIILEKMPAGGGNTRIAAGVIMGATAIADAVSYVTALCAGTTGRELVETFVRESVKNKDWIESIGGEVEPRVPGGDIFYPVIRVPCWPNIPGSDALSWYGIKRSKGKGKEGLLFGGELWQLLSTNVERRGISVMTGTRARELVMNEQGEVTGIIAEMEGDTVTVVAKKAVVLACGGFAYNEAMKQAFLLSRPFYALGSPGNTGDGIIMAEKAGAALWHMPAVAAPLGFKAPEYGAAFHIMMRSERHIYVDEDGRRFVDEAGVEMHNMGLLVSFFDLDRSCFPRLPSYAVFDEVARRKGPLAREINESAEYKWSPDNSREIDRGWIRQGETLRTLAGKISVDGASLENTVARYNEFCKAGRDADFGRARESLGPIEQPPYYAIALWPCLLNTQGGPRRDKDSRVVNYDSKPIPRLYSAGELGSLWGFLYEGGGNLAECLVSGRIAGQNAAAEEPWH